MPKTLGIWEWGCPERGDAQNAVPGWNFLYSAQASFCWPRVASASIFSVCLDLSKSVGFVSLSGKVALVFISAAILLLRSCHVYFPLEFEFR